jgi:hypothetical protein
MGSDNEELQLLILVINFFIRCLDDATQTNRPH